VNEPHAWFDYDNELGMKMAVQHLLEHGHSHIGLISAPLEMNFARQRFDSFKLNLQDAGLSVNPDNLIDGVNDRRSGYAAMQKLLTGAVRPTAVVVDNHMSGVGAMRALLDANVKVGQEMSVIVWGRMEDSLANYHVTTIEQPDPDKAGVKMVEMLLALINGTSPSELQECWAPILLPGETVARLSRD
jgi:LacI family transcriptional regulator